MRFTEHPRQRLALLVFAQTVDALRLGRITEVEAYYAVSLAVHAVTTHDPAGLARRVEDMERVHGIAPDLGKGAA